MAGERQHIIPRFLQRGFASKIEGKKVFTWFYRKDGSCLELSTRDVFLEKFFYKNDQGISVDEEITKIEKGFALMLEEIRKQEHGVELNQHNIPEFIAHMCIRTKHLVDSTNEAINNLIIETEKYLGDINNIRNFLMNDFNFKKEITVSLKSQFPQLSIIVIETLIPIFIKTFFDENKGRILMASQAFFSQFRRSLPKVLKSSFIDVLSNGLVVPEPRVSDYHSFKWFVFVSQKPFILGDVGCLFEVLGKKEYTFLNMKGDVIRNIYLPISSNKLLIGTKEENMPNIDVEQFNINYVKICRECFICHAPSDEMSFLAGELGKNSELFNKEEFEQMVRKNFLNRMFTNFCSNEG